MKVSEVLKAGKSALDGGWSQHALCTSDGRVCAVGALCVAIGSERHRDRITATPFPDAGLRAFRLLSETALIDQNIVSTNNHPDMTIEGVRAWFDATIAIAEQQEREKDVPIEVLVGAR